MLPRGVNPLRLDLRQHQCTQLILLGTIALDQSKVEALSQMIKAARQRQEWPWVFGERYRAGGGWYFVETFLYPARQTGVLNIQMVFSRGKEITPRVAAIAPMLDALSDSETAITVTCNAHFDYAENEGASTVPLPVGSQEAIALPEGPKMRFQVRGLRITQLDEEGSEDFSIVIDRPTNEEFHHTVSFERISALSDDLPGQLLERASEISGIFFKLAEKQVSTKASKEKRDA